MASCLPTIVNKLKVRAIQNIITAVDVFAAKLMNDMPKYNHFLNDEKYNKGFVTKHLLNHPFRDSAGQQFQRLWKNLAGVAEIHTEWHVTPKLEENAVLVDSMAHAQMVLDAGRELMNVLSGVSVVQELEGQERVSTAVALIAKPTFLIPAALKAELVAIAATADEPAAKKAKKG